MTSSRRRRSSRVNAERATVSNVLSQLDPDDYLGRIGLESRLQELEEESQGQEQAEPFDTLASASLYFGGDPVVGSMGIESGFAGEAVSKYQDLVAKLAIEDRQSLGQRGPLPAHDHAKLHITGILRGSFGFRLEELRSVGSIFDTPLKEAVNKATHMLEAFTDASEEGFEETLASVDPRTASAAREFFALLGSHNATMRLQTGDIELEFLRPAIQRARDRALSSNVEEETLQVDGRLAGLLPTAHTFELETEGEEVLDGRVTKLLDKNDLAQLLRTYLNQPVTATVLVRRVFRRGQLARQSYTLKSLTGLSLFRGSDRT